MDHPILYSYFRSSSSHRVRIALHLKKIEFEYRAVHLIKDGGEQHKDSYTALNPKEEVPVFVDGTFKLTQSMAILFYLDQKWPTPALFPKDPALFARCIEICEIINSGIQPFHNLKLIQHVIDRYGIDPKERGPWSSHWIGLGFHALESLLKKASGNYCIGNHVSAADCFLVPQVFAAQRFQVDMNPYPTISKVFDQCQRLDAFAKAEPKQQPDWEK